MQQQMQVYKGEKAHQRGVAKMIRAGWRVQSDVSSVPKRGCIGTILFGLLSRNKTVFTVTYARD